MIIGALLIAAAVGLFAFLGSDSNPKEDIARLSAKLQSVQTVADTSHKNIVSSDLRGINSTLSLTLTNANRDIGPLLTANGLEAKKLDPNIVADQKTDATLKSLNDAWLNAVFDRSYAREMSYQLETLIVLLNQIEDDTNDASLKKFITSTRDNIEPLRERFANFTASTS